VTVVDLLKAMTDVRIDKWLWAVRIYRTRSLAAAACAAGHVQVGDQIAKAARSVRLGDIVLARIGPMTRTVRVRELLDRRVGAPLVERYLEDLTPPSEHEKRAAPNFQPVALRPKGSGRPTKRDRRDIDALEANL
jgi:ribosome-associated heat shock protein Hsp15